MGLEDITRENTFKERAMCLPWKQLKITQAPCGFKHACDRHKSRSRCFWLWGIVAQKHECAFVLYWWGWQACCTTIQRMRRTRAPPPGSINRLPNPHVIGQFNIFVQFLLSDTKQRSEVKRGSSYQPFAAGAGELHQCFERKEWQQIRQLQRQQAHAIAQGTAIRFFVNRDTRGIFFLISVVLLGFSHVCRIL